MQVVSNVKTVDIGKLDPNPWNPNKQTDFIYEKELESIRQHGFIDPVTVREAKGRFQIIDGEHRWKAARELGYKTISINNLGKLDDYKAKQLTLILNETKGKPDTDLLSKLLADLEKTMGLEDMAKILPYTPMEMETMIQKVKVDWESVSPELTKPRDPLNTSGKDDHKDILISVPIEMHGAFFEGLDKINKKLKLDAGSSKTYVTAIGVLIRLINDTDLEDFLGSPTQKKSKK